MPEEGNQEGKADLAELSPEDLVEIIKTLRKENAARRVKDKALEGNLREYEDWKTSQLSETEKLRKERDDAVAEARKALIDTYSDRFGVPEERKKFLLAIDTAEEIMAAAKILGVAKEGSGVDNDGKGTGSAPTGTPTTQTPVQPAVNLFPGVSGPAVGSKSTSTNDEMLRAALRGER